MAFKGAIFDFDGVVVDTTPLHYSSWEKLLLDDHNCAFDSIIYEDKVNGRKSSDALAELLPHLTDKQLERALILKQEYYHELIAEGKLKVFASTVSLIKELMAKGIKIAVASSSRSVAYVLEKSNIIDLFAVIISGRDTKLGKPHPESFLNAAKQLHLDISECVVFEDAKVGVQAARAGGFVCVGIDRHGNSAHYAQADLCVHDLKEVDYTKLTTLFNDMN